MENVLTPENLETFINGKLANEILLVLIIFVVGMGLLILFLARAYLPVLKSHNEALNVIAQAMLKQNNTIDMLADKQATNSEHINDMRDLVVELNTSIKALPEDIKKSVVPLLTDFLKTLGIAVHNNTSNNNQVPLGNNQNPYPMNRGILARLLGL